VFAAGTATEGVLVAVAGADAVDWIGSANISSGTTMDTDALLAICRVAHGDVVENLGIDGTRVRVDAAALERLAASGRHVGVG
jgi:hypothetical protein